MARKQLGILGGMGPLASAEFLATIYRRSCFEFEQDSPSCLLYSDPDIPDRTAAILSGNVTLLVDRLSAAVEKLLHMESHRIVIACVTAHAVLAMLPQELQQHVISIIDLTVAEIASTPGRFLLLTSQGTRAARIFQDHPRWPAIKDQIVLLDPSEQDLLHDWIYRIKRKGAAEECMDWLGSLAEPKKVDGFIFGCTELHLLHRVFETRAELAHLRLIDPLLITARELPRLMA